MIEPLTNQQHLFIITLNVSNELLVNFVVDSDFIFWHLWSL